MPNRMRDDRDQPDRPQRRDAFADLDLMDSLAAENERRCCRIFPVDPVVEMREQDGDPGRGGADRVDLDLNPAGVREPIERAVEVADAGLSTEVGSDLYGGDAERALGGGDLLGGVEDDLGLVGDGLPEVEF